MRTASLGSIIALVAFITSSGPALAGSLSADVERQVQQNLPELLDLLAIPNVADQPADIQRNATFLEQAFAKRGFKVRRVDNPAQRPAVLAELSGAGPQARTVLLYAPRTGCSRIRFDPSSDDETRRESGRTSGARHCRRIRWIPSCACSRAPLPTTRRRS
jgi:hypothetical protein